ncbi:NRDE family protein [Dasania marina]|uniref:NRDE family protein n=1 Tax=Dasania marina TaxID=471499 RepID=UPI0030DA56B3|tara:strand:+ start:7825 stop:8631 length:807 start_codon:yes stop_codon:yes gene_type:complete
MPLFYVPYFMCLISFAIQQHADWPLILMANRDEYHQRPSAAAHFWQDQPQLFAGRDLQAGGTWLGISQQGQLAAVTNYRETAAQNAVPRYSRGALSSDFLSGPQSASDYLQQLATHAEDFAGFNFICGNPSQLYYFSNRQGTVRSLKPGIYGLSNGLLDSPWPKVDAAKDALQQRLNSGSINCAGFIADMQNRQAASPQQLPHTGISSQREQLLSSCFIVSGDYGTRCSTAVLFHRSGRIFFMEQSYDAQGRAHYSVQQQLRTAPIPR